MWIRTCQSCGNKQEDKMPQGEYTQTYENRKCNKCKSMDLDYGKEQSDDRRI